MALLGCVFLSGERLGYRDVGLMPMPERGDWNGWLTCVTFVSCSIHHRVIVTLTEVEIESRLHGKPMHLQPVFPDAESWVNGVSEGLFDVGVCLPSGSAFTAEAVDKVTSLVWKVGDHR